MNSTHCLQHHGQSNLHTLMASFSSAEARNRQRKKLWKAEGACLRAGAARPSARRAYRLDLCLSRRRRTGGRLFEAVLLVAQPAPAAPVAAPPQPQIPRPLPLPKPIPKKGSPFRKSWSRPSPSGKRNPYRKTKAQATENKNRHLGGPRPRSVPRPRAGSGGNPKGGPQGGSTLRPWKTPSTIPPASADSPETTTLFGGQGDALKGTVRMKKSTSSPTARLGKSLWYRWPCHIGRGGVSI